MIAIWSFGSRPPQIRGALYVILSDERLGEWLGNLVRGVLNFLNFPKLPNHIF